MPKLSDSERFDFLNEQGVLMRIAVVQSDGAPMVTPIWFLHREGELLFTPRIKSSWYHALQLDPRVSLCIDEEALPYRKILVQGQAQCLFEVGCDADWRSLYLEMATKYVGPRGAEKYVADTLEQPRTLYRVLLSESKMTSWRMPLSGEPSMGIWAKKYYQPGTEF